MVLRSSKSCCTVSFSKPVRKMFCAFSKSFLSASRSFCLSDFFFIVCLYSRFLRSRLGSDLFSVEGGYIQVNAGSHGRANGYALYVFTFGGCRLGLYQSLNQAIGIFQQVSPF